MGRCRIVAPGRNESKRCAGAHTGFSPERGSADVYRFFNRPAGFLFLATGFVLLRVGADTVGDTLLALSTAVASTSET
jgi:hypothetical protein